ncbi:MAG: hypothetical protein L6R37_008238 [Teloschistes peruensis]|nr:MAG: hypothetical protein L6R37_008238 [Teloschistes peruensis]
MVHNQAFSPAPKVHSPILRKIASKLSTAETCAGVAGRNSSNSAMSSVGGVAEYLSLHILKKRFTDIIQLFEELSRRCLLTINDLSSAANANILPPEASGGLYKRMFLDGNAHILGEDPKFPPKSWHGCPLAALSRAFHSLGTQSHLFPRQIRQQLRDLQDLYGTNDQVAGALPNTQALPLEAAALQGHASTSNTNASFPYPPQPSQNLYNHRSGDGQGPTTSGQQTKGVSEVAQATATTLNDRKRAASDDLDASASQNQELEGQTQEKEQSRGFWEVEPVGARTLSTGAEEKPELKQEAVQAVLPSPQPSTV